MSYARHWARKTASKDEENFTLKSERKTKEKRHNVGNIFDISFHEISPKYAFRLQHKHSFCLHSFPYVFHQK